MKSNNPLRNIIKSEEIYRGHILNLRVDTVKFPTGSQKIREVVEHGAAVGVLPIAADGRMILVKQYRHAIDKEIFEIPAGLVEKGEDPYLTAERELQEEIGYKPGKLTEIAHFYTSPGFSDEELYIYAACDLTPSSLPQDDDEYIKVFSFTDDELESLISEGCIDDGKTLLAYWWYKARERRA
ncbi:MAG: NUDIX hydrolase [Synergistes sp.]|nr:NUDIX hydrolase [Synergistes sp.]